MRTAKKVAEVGDSYFELIREFPLRRIKSSAEHAKAQGLFLKLSVREQDPGVLEYVDVLVDLIVDYEKRAGYKLDVSHVTVAELIRFRLEERGVSVSAFAKQIGIPQSNLSDMLNGKRGWSKSAIRAISAALSIKAERFLACI